MKRARLLLVGTSIACHGAGSEAPTAQRPPAQTTLAQLELTRCWTATAPSPEVEFGDHVVRVGDVDRDGVSDLVVSLWQFWRTGAVRCLSGRDGSVLWELRCPSHEGRGTCDCWLGRGMCSIEDVDADGVADFAVGCAGAPPLAGPVPPYGAWIVSAASGVVLCGRLQYDNDVMGYGSALASPGDIDADGTPDLLIRSWSPRHDQCVDALSGRTGALIYRAPLDYLGAREPMLVVVEDCDGDGLRDFLDVTLASNHRSSSSSLYSSRTGRRVSADYPTPQFARLGDYEVLGPGDLDGDGRCETSRALRSERGFGSTEIMSSSDGRPLVTLDLPNWGVVNLGDLDGDGNVEIAPIDGELKCVQVFTLRRR